MQYFESPTAQPQTSVTLLAAEAPAPASGRCCTWPPRIEK